MSKCKGTYVKLYENIYDHPKTIEIASALIELGVPKLYATDLAVAQFHRLACYLLRNGDNGEFGSLGPRRFAEVVGFRTDHTRCQCMHPRSDGNARVLDDECSHHVALHAAWMQSGYVSVDNRIKGQKSARLHEFETHFADILRHRNTQKARKKVDNFDSSDTTGTPRSSTRGKHVSSTCQTRADNVSYGKRKTEVGKRKAADGNCASNDALGERRQPTSETPASGLKSTPLVPPDGGLPSPEDVLHQRSWSAASHEAQSLPIVLNKAAEEAIPPGAALQLATRSIARRPSGLTPEDLADLWAEIVCDRHAGKRIPRVTIRGDGRVAPALRTQLSMAIRRDGDDPAEWRQFLENVSSSPFLCGYSSAGWTATLAWVCGPQNRAKIEAGNYEGANGSSPFNASPLERAERARMEYYKSEILGSDPEPQDANWTYISEGEEAHE
ncbi:MAG TPA: hypothetical protein PKA37_10015 [Planctomycetota bacterium]|jgi:hypothetical protein|nr:hypothetical protein [Planctomycetota bacterium]